MGLPFHRIALHSLTGGRHDGIDHAGDAAHLPDVVNPDDVSAVGDPPGNRGGGPIQPLVDGKVQGIADH